MVDLKFSKIHSVESYNDLMVQTQLPTDYVDLWKPALLHGWMEMFAASQQNGTRYIGRLAMLLDNRNNPNTLEIVSLFVSGEEREQGVGTALMQMAEQDAARKGGNRLVLSVSPENTAAINLYKKLGYKTKSKAVNLIQMSKKLK